MKKDLAAEFLVSTFSALANVIVNLAVKKQIDWLWVVFAFVIPFVVLLLYQGVISVRVRPYKRWKIAKGELVNYFGTTRGEVLEFDRDSEEGHGFYGPYIPLTKGKYRVLFRLKIDARDEQGEPVCELDVTSNKGQKYFAQRTISIRDFKRSDQWQDFPLDFSMAYDENNVEFRFRMKNVERVQRRITFDSVMVYKRLL